MTTTHVYSIVQTLLYLVSWRWFLLIPAIRQMAIFNLIRAHTKMYASSLRISASGTSGFDVGNTGQSSDLCQVCKHLQ